MQDCGGWRGWHAVTDPRLYEWIVLRRVAGGSIAKSAGMYFDHGRPIPGHLIEVFDGSLGMDCLWLRMVILFGSCAGSA